MAIIFFIFATVAFFTVFHGLVHQDEQDLAFIIALFLFITCMLIAYKHKITGF